jgi:hypothetical protein
MCGLIGKKSAYWGQTKFEYPLLEGGGGWHGGGGHGGGYRGGWGGGGWGGGWGPDWGPDYYYDEPGDCGWVRVPVLRHGHRVVQRVWRCW